MGLLVKGQWQDLGYETEKNKGEFIRWDSAFRRVIGKDLPVEANRYHLYVSYACPWAHRTLIFRALKGLQKIIGVSVVSPLMLDQGWSFDEASGSTGDPLQGAKYLHQIYTQHQSDYSGRVTVPVLWDKKESQIVNNESAEIIRQLNTGFAALTDDKADYYPPDLQIEIDAFNQEVYENINNGVYRAGFATTQEAYEAAYTRLFDALDNIENHLSTHRFLVGNRLTEADWRLFTTLIRFDKVYYGHFKCNRQPLETFPALSGYVRELYQWPGISETVHFDHIQQHYYYSHVAINPTRIVPCGPRIDYTKAHHRGTLKGFDAMGAAL